MGGGRVDREHIHIHMYMHAYIYIYIYTCIYIHIYMFVHIHTYTYIHTDMTFTYAHVHMDWSTKNAGSTKNAFPGPQMRNISLPVRSRSRTDAKRERHITSGCDIFRQLEMSSHGIDNVACRTLSHDCDHHWSTKFPMESAQTDPQRSKKPKEARMLGVPRLGNGKASVTPPDVGTLIMIIVLVARLMST